MLTHIVCCFQILKFMQKSNRIQISNQTQVQLLHALDAKKNGGRSFYQAAINVNIL